MVDEKVSANGPRSIPRKAGQETAMIGPIPVGKMVVLILSVTVGGWLAHDVLARFPHSTAVYFLAAMAFLFSVEMGAGIAFVASIGLKAITKAVALRSGGPGEPEWNAQLRESQSDIAETAHPFPR